MKTPCMNCGLSSHRERRYMLAQLGTEIIQRIHQWLPQGQFSDEGFICSQCLNTIQISLDATDAPQRQLGHPQVCVWCGKSILRTRSNALQLNTRERLFIEEKISPRQLPEGARVCYACWVAAKRNIQRCATTDVERQIMVAEESGLTTSAEVETVVTHQIPEESEIHTQDQHDTPGTPNRPVNMALPNYRRTADTPGHCIYPNCNNVERLRVPRTIRLRLLSDFKLYVPKSARICIEHIRQFNWDSAVEQNEFIQTFSPEQIEDMLDLLNDLRCAFKLDFECIETWSPHICHYWLGHSVEHIMQIINECPTLRTTCNAKSVIGVYLLKLRTGDSNERLGTLLQIPTTTIARRLKKARDILSREFVSQPLGLQCLPRPSLLNNN